MPVKPTNYINHRFVWVAVFLYTALQTHLCKSEPGQPVKFIENKGQWDSRALFAVDIPGGRMFLGKHGITYAIPDQVALEERYHHSEEAHSVGRQLHLSKEVEVLGLNLDFVGGNPNPTLVPSHPSTELYNYFLGNDPKKWASGCRAFQTVTYKELYPSIDLKAYITSHGLKYDLILRKGADPRQIKFRYRGAEHIALVDQRVQTKTRFNQIIENIPYAYQVNKAGRKRQVQCQFKLDGDEVSFEFSKGYNAEETLVIDPELIFSTFSGSVANNFGFTACYDEAGNLYSGGNVFGTGFPATNGSNFMGLTTDIGILKYDSSGTRLLYATYLGGSSEDIPHSLVVNNQNQLVLMGTTGSQNFPTGNGAFDSDFNGGTPFNVFGTLENGSDIIVSKLDESGNLLASTYVGGPGNDGILKITARQVNGYINKLIRNYGDYLRGDIIMDEDDNLYIASSTDDVDFPITSGIQAIYNGGNSDAVVFSLSSDLSTLRWSTYLGGSDDDAAYSIKLDQNNDVYVGGGTTSTDFPSTTNALNPNHMGDVDGFITKISQSGDSIVHSTYLGTSAYDQAYFIDLDDQDNVFTFGQTKGTYPVTSGTFNVPNSSQFVHKLSPDLSTTDFSLVFGSGQLEPNISPTAFLVNDCNNIFLSGWGGQVNTSPRSINTGNTFNLPVTSDALYPTTDGSDFYLMALTADGSELLYATFFGGTNVTTEDHVDGGTSRFDKRGIVYQSICSCGGSSDNFPTTPGAWSRANNSSNNRCNNAAFKFDLASLEARIGTNTPLLDNPGINSGCIPLDILFVNNSTGGEEFLWDFGDGTTSSDAGNVQHKYTVPGVYTITLRARDDKTCIKEDITSMRLFVHENNFSISDPFQICEGEEVTLTATGSVDYTWVTPTGAIVSKTESLTVSPDQTTTYSVTATDQNSCVFEGSVEVTVIPSTIMAFDVVQQNNCGSEPFLGFQNNSLHDGLFVWDFGDGNISNDRHPMHEYEEYGEYTVRLTARNVACVVEETKNVTYSEFFIPNVFTPNNDGINDTFVINSVQRIDLKVYDRSGLEVYQSADYKNDWNGGNHPSGVYFYEITFPNGEVCNSWVQLLK